MSQSQSPVGQCLTQGKLSVTLYKQGAVINWNLPARKQHNLSRRGEIGAASKRALRRAAFFLGNAERDWGVMATLTHRTQPKNLKLANRSFGRAVAREFGADFQWAWFMEFQRRGVIHYHWFFERDELERRGWLAPENIQPIVRHAHATLLIRGDFERFVVSHWTRCAHANAEIERRFNTGGICEMVRSPDAAGRYVAAYAAKPLQKTLPQGIEKAGRWWAMSRAGRPIPRGTMQVTHYPFPCRYKYVFDHKVLDELIETRDPVTVWPKLPECYYRGKLVENSITNVTQLTSLPEMPLCEPKGGDSDEILSSSKLL